MVGISGTALAWFASYLQDRLQRVSINNEYSLTAKLECGAPQGSVLGPVLFTTYLLLLGKILRELGVTFHCYADDTQFYIPFYFDDNTWVSDMERYLAVIHSWMTSNLLKLNANKTEMLLLSIQWIRRKYGDRPGCVTLPGHVFVSSVFIHFHFVMQSWIVIFHVDCIYEICQFEWNRISYESHMRTSQIE